MDVVRQAPSNTRRLPIAATLATHMDGRNGERDAAHVERHPAIEERHPELMIRDAKGEAGEACTWAGRSENAIVDVYTAGQGIQFGCSHAAAR